MRSAQETSVQCVVKPCKEKAISLVEMVIAVSVLAIFAGAAVSAFSGIKGFAESQKLVSDVRAINSALNVYAASGGFVGTLSDPQQVFDKLKTSVASNLADRLPSISGAVIDPRLTVETITSIPAGDFAEWNPTSGQFEIVSNGSPTQSIRIKAFALADQPTAAASEERNPSMKYSEVSGWIWDYQGRAPDTLPGPTVIPLGPSIAYPIPPPTGVPPPVQLPLPAQHLDPPTFSLPGGGLGTPWTTADFPLSRTLGNPNPGGSSNIIFWINSGTPAVYAGQTLSIARNDTFSAYARSMDTAQRIDSYAVREVYTEEITNPNIGFSMSVSVSPRYSSTLDLEQA